MTASSFPPAPPRGLRRLLWRLPVALFRAGLGWLFGGRLVLIEHRGRRTGRPRATVVEVVARDPATGTVTVASGFGHTADWYRNLLAHPAATIRTGVRRHQVTACPLTPEAGSAFMLDYAARHPATAMRLARFMGFAAGDAAPDYAVVGSTVPFLALVPAPGTGPARPAGH